MQQQFIICQEYGLIGTQGKGQFSVSVRRLQQRGFCYGSGMGIEQTEPSGGGSEPDGIGGRGSVYVTEVPYVTAFYYLMDIVEWLVG